MGMPIKIIKNRSDLGAGTRGSDLGIDALEIAAINMNSTFFNIHEVEDIKTRNEVIYSKIKHPYAKHVEGIVEQCTALSTSVKEVLNTNAFPLVLSGDHSSALGTISGIKEAFPEATLGVIWIDAHADLHSPYTSPSGNIHGMPLAAVLNEDNLSCKINDVSDTTKHQWDMLKNIGTKGAKLSSDHLIYFGVRDTEAPEDAQIDALKIKNYKVEEVRYRGLKTCVEEALESLSNCDMIYVSFDVDSMDCDMVSYGTGTPVPKGFDPDEVTKIMQLILETGKVKVLEFVEVNPILDTKGNVMAETAFKVLENVTKSIV